MALCLVPPTQPDGLRDPNLFGTCFCPHCMHWGSEDLPGVSRQDGVRAAASLMWSASSLRNKHQELALGKEAF